jgi:hypothetical protein
MNFHFLAIEITNKLDANHYMIQNSEYKLSLNFKFNLF